MEDDRNAEIDVGSPEGWEWALDKLAGFHDGVVRRLTVVHKDRVSSDLRMISGLFPDVEALIQFQSRRVPAVLLRFANVHQLRFDPMLDHQDRDAQFHGTLGSYLFLSCEINSESAFMTVLDDSFLDSKLA